MSLTIAERDTQIVKLAIAGMPPAEIEEALAGEVTRSTIYTTLVAARARGVAVPYYRTNGAPVGRPDLAPSRGALHQTAAIRVGRDLLRLYDEPALRRGVTTPQLIRAVLAAVAEGGLIDAVFAERIALPAPERR